MRALPFPLQPITPRSRSWQDGNPAAGAAGLIQTAFNVCYALSLVLSSLLLTLGYMAHCWELLGMWA